MASQKIDSDSNMKIHHAIASFLLLVSTAFSAGQKPNVVFIVCDDMNTHVTTSGYPHIQTPNFSRLAADGMTFNRAYCQYPVCGPSRASFLSGLYPESTGVIDNKSDIREVRPGTVSMPQAFKDQGYWTAATGKVFHNSKTDQGDTTWSEHFWFENDEMPIEATARRKFEAEHGPITDRKNKMAWKKFLPTVATQTRGQQPGYGPSGLSDDQHRDGKNAKQVGEWLDKRSYGDQPFFIAVGIHKPHGPFLAPDAYFDLYPRDKLVFNPTPSDIWDRIPKSAMNKRYEGFGFEFGVENDSLRREYMQAYHACISFVDAQIGRVFDSLKKNGLWDNTIIVLTTDHGYHLGDHFMWGKVTLFEIGNRVPLIVRAPGVTTPGSTSEGLVEMIDYYPTLAELAGINPPADLQGKSFVPMLRDAKAAGKEVVYTIVTRGQKLGRALRTQRWRYTLWPDGEELYDLDTDPEELHNLAGDSLQDATLKEMRRLVHGQGELARSARKL
jgi:iduronate 2-sulfatase